MNTTKRILRTAAEIAAVSPTPAAALPPKVVEFIIEPDAADVAALARVNGGDLNLARHQVIERRDAKLARLREACPSGASQADKLAASALALVAEYNRTIAEGFAAIDQAEGLTSRHCEALKAIAAAQSELDQANTALAGNAILALSPADAFALNLKSQRLPSMIKDLKERAAALARELAAWLADRQIKL